MKAEQRDLRATKAVADLAKSAELLAPAANSMLLAVPAGVRDKDAESLLVESAEALATASKTISVPVAKLSETLAAPMARG